MRKLLVLLLLIPTVAVADDHHLTFTDADISAIQSALSKAPFGEVVTVWNKLAQQLAMEHANAQQKPQTSSNDGRSRAQPEVRP